MPLSSISAQLAVIRGETGDLNEIRSAAPGQTKNQEATFIPNKLNYIVSERIIRINKDMQLILYSPGIWVIHSEGRYITEIRMQTTK